MGKRKKTRDRTRVFVVQDRSGSMIARKDETISGFNEYLGTIKKDQGDEVFLSLIQFDTDVSEMIVNQPVAEVKDLTSSDYIPGGMTALLDGVGTAIRIAEKASGDNDKVLIVIMTDGYENSSKEYSKDQISTTIKAKRDDGWEFVFLGAGEASWSANEAYFGGAIPPSNSILYGTAAHTHSVAYSTLSSSTTRLRNATRGATAQAVAFTQEEIDAVVNS